MEFMRIILRLLAAVFFAVADEFHFLMPEIYLQIMPPYFLTLPLLIAVGGTAEIAGGISLLIRPLRHATGGD